MQDFRHLDARSFREVPRLARRGTALLAGGTDLVPLMRDGLARPRTVINLKTIAGGRAIRGSRGGATLGALALVADIAEHAGVRRWFPALAEACAAVGTLQIRNMATLGGNLCQRIRCWYFRQQVPCHKTGGRGCPAERGLNEYLAVIGSGPCRAPHPSDPAVALAALDARVQVRGPRGRLARLTVARLYARAAERRDGETVLRPGDVIERVTVPGRYAGARQRFWKVTQREAWDFALVSLAAVWPRGRGARPRLVLGGVAPSPLEVDWNDASAGRALANASPLRENGYKIAIARNLIREALEWNPE